MSAPGQTLREIHRLRKQAKDLTSRIELAPIQLRAQRNALAKAEEAVKQAQDAIKHLKVKIHEKEVSVKSVEAVIKKHEQQFAQASNKKEYDALKSEIAHEKKAIVKLEDEILEVMGEVEEKTSKLPEMEQAVKKAKADLAKFEADQGERLGRFGAERTAALAQLAQVEENLPEEILIVYNREVQSRGEDALAAVENRTCIACYTEITPQMHNDLSRGSFVACKACGRILYLPE